MINEKLAEVLRNIERAAKKGGRQPENVRLICVTKEADPVHILQALSLGIKDLGENRVQDANLKYMDLGNKVVWHMIGHLQTNKAKDAVKIFSLIHSLDSMRLAEAINKEASMEGKVQDCLVEVNVSGERSKFGIYPEDAGNFIAAAKGLGNIRILGLMTVAPFSDVAESSREFFRALKRLADKHGLKELSMGMSQDYEVAVEEGATMLRIGRAIFR